MTTLNCSTASRSMSQRAWRSLSCVRRRIEMDGGAALQAVEPGIGEAHAAPVEPRDVERAAPRAPLAAHLEQVGEIGVEADFERDRPLDPVEPPDPDPFVAGGAAQELDPRGVDRIALQPDLALGIVEIGIGEIDHHRAIVVEQDRAEQQRLHPADPERLRPERKRVSW